MNLLFRSPIKPDFNIQKEEKVEGGGGEREREKSLHVTRKNIRLIHE